MAPQYAYASIHEGFEVQACRSPQAPAILTEHLRVTYAALDARASRIAADLRARGVGPETLVGLHGARTPQAVAGLLGILKAGGAYVPIDPDYPPDRVAFMIADSRITLVLTDVAEPACRNTDGVEWMYLEPEAFAEAPEAGRPGARVGPEAAAAVIYTSGSTGRPKGVAIPHRAILARVRNGYVPRDGDVQKASVSVVAHVSDLLVPLLVGLPVRPIAADIVKHTAALAQALLRHGATRAVFVPSQLRALLEGGDHVIRALRTLDTLIVGGEGITADLIELVRSRLPGVALVNGYGITETTGIVSMADVTHADTISVGAPFPESAVHVLDRELNRLPPGVAGAVYVGGPQLARGYLNQAALTAERFVPDSIAADGRRLYRTGDFGRYTADGAVEILGRDDYEVKLRGFRVDVREVEAALEQHPAVAQAVAIGRTVGGSTQLSVIWKARHAQIPSADLRAFLQSKLPSYMMPATVIATDQFPLLPNGKIDRSRVAEMCASHAEDRPRPPLHRRQPTDTEALLAGIWTEVLNVESVQVEDDFFALGGDSLLAMRVLSRIAARYDIELTPVDLSLHPTIEAFGQFLDIATHAA